MTETPSSPAATAATLADIMFDDTGTTLAGGRRPPTPSWTTPRACPWPRPDPAGPSPSASSGYPMSSRCTDGVAPLSPHQARILSLLAEDLTMHQIASRIGFSESTVRMESLAIYRALGVHDRRHAVEAAGSLGDQAHP